MPQELKLPVEGIPLLPPDVDAPEKQTLRYTSHPKLYAIPSDQSPADGEYEGFRLCEHYVPKPQPGLPPHMGEYTVSIEASIAKSGEFHEASHKMVEIARDLDKFWVWACGEPLAPFLMGLSFDITPTGWQSNVEEVKSYFLANCQKPFAVVRINPRHWIAMPYYPLLPAIRVREQYKKADPLTQALADLHYGALKSPLGEGKLFSLARGLELARRILPGNNDASKEKALHLQPTGLKRSLHWPFDVGNNRFNTRHVVQKSSPIPALNARMSGQELMD